MWLRNLLVVLFALYVVELVADNLLPFSLYSLFAWYDLVESPWQIVTRYALQGQNVLRVVFDLLILYSIVPRVLEGLGWREMNRATAAIVIGGTATAGVLGALHLASAPNLGWHGLSVGALTVFGLLNPDATILFSFIFPVPGRVIAWGTGVICALVFLSSPTMIAADDLGSWLGIMAWYASVGPGGRRRKLMTKGRKLADDIARFKVLPGGKNQGGKNRDETFH